MKDRGIEKRTDRGRSYMGLSTGQKVGRWDPDVGATGIDLAHYTTVPAQENLLKATKDAV